MHCKKTNSKNRTCYSKDQVQKLEEIYQRGQYITTEQKTDLAKSIGVKEEKIKV